MAFINSADGRINARFNPDGVTYVNAPSKKEVIGLRVRALAGQGGGVPTPDYIASPGFSTPGAVFGTFVDSPLLFTVNPNNQYLIQPNDVITHANKCALGDLHNQIPISVILWRLLAGDNLRLGVRSNADNYELVRAVNVTLTSNMPRFQNYPWYKYHDIPLNQLEGSLGQFFSALPLIGGVPFFPSV